MISVLVPTRKRPDLLKRSIQSLLDTATGPIEVLVAVDNDDPSYVGLNFPSGNVIGKTFYERPGYQALHEYYNELATIAKGDWLMLWNDDALMHTRGWNHVIESQAPGPCVLNLFPGQLNIFPVMSRALYDILGHFALNNHNDTYLEYVSRGAGIERVVEGVKISHIRDTLNDEIRHETKAANDITSAKFYGDDVQALIQEDIKKIKAALS